MPEEDEEPKKCDLQRIIILSSSLGIALASSLTVLGSTNANRASLLRIPVLRYCMTYLYEKMHVISEQTGLSTLHYITTYTHITFEEVALASPHT